MNVTISAIGKLTLFVSVIAIQGFQTESAEAQYDSPRIQKQFDEIRKKRKRVASEEEKKRFIAALPRLKAIQSREERKILAIKGVISIGIGLHQGKPAFIVTMDQRFPTDAVPTQIGGIPVTVDRSEPFRLLDSATEGCDDGEGPPCHVNKTPLPVKMGNSARWFQQSGGCTAGFKACDLGSGKLVFITNSHCAQFSNGCNLAPLGDAVWHPALGDGGPGVNRVTIGTIAGHAAPSCSRPDNFVDATKVISSSSLTSPDYRDLGPLSGFVTEIYPNDIVVYVGRSHGVNFGGVRAVHETVLVPEPSDGGFCCGPLTMRDQVIVQTVGVALGGDSGSGVLLLDPDDTYKIAGLLFGHSGSYAYFNPLDRVVSALNLTMNLSRCE